MVVVAAQADDTSAPDVDDPASPMPSEVSVKYIKVATSTTITEDVTVKESTGAAPGSRKLHSSS